MLNVTYLIQSTENNKQTVFDTNAYLLNSKKLIVVYCLNCVVVVNDEAMILTTLFHKKVITFIFDVSSIYSNISANSHPLLLTNRGWYESYKISHLEKYKSVNVKKLDEYYHCTLITTFKNISQGQHMTTVSENQGCIFCF